MNVLFCNTGWMKYYDGTPDDQLIHGGKWVQEHQDGVEKHNFLDYNGKCYGYVSAGNMLLEKHYKDVTRQQSFIKNMLVIWVANKEKGQTRIVGWYKNATVYREQQFLEAFTDPNCDRIFQVEALAKDCFLLPEEERTFPIERAAQSGKGMGMGQANVWYAESSFAQTVIVPKVLEYIEGYKGQFANIVLADEEYEATLDDNDVISDYQSIFDKGMEYVRKEALEEALQCFNSARKVKETPEVLKQIAHIMVDVLAFDRAIILYEKAVEMEGDKADSILGLIDAYDGTANREKTMEYCNRYLALEGDAKEILEDKAFVCLVQYCIYFIWKDAHKAKDALNRMLDFRDDEKTRHLVAENLKVLSRESKNWR